MAVEPRSGTRRDFGTLRRSVTFAGIALIVLIVGADSYEAWQDYRRVSVDNEHIMLALSRALTEQTERLVQETEVVLSDYAAWATSAEGRKVPQSALVARLNSQIVSLPFISSALLIGTDGRVLASTRSDEGGERNLKELAVFSAPAHGVANALYIDRPRALGGGAQTFALSRRVTTAAGELAGVVVARVAFDYLAAFYAGVNVTPDTSIRLSRMDGVTLVEYPPGGNVAAKSGERPRAAGAATKERIKYSVTNGDEMIQVSQEVGGYPVIVTVSRSSASVLRPWIQEERSSAARTLTLAVFAALLLMALRAALHRQDQMDQERHRLEQELAGIRQVEALGFLAAAVAHDFNNVLTAIIGYAELLRDMVEAEPAVLANVDRLLAATERARLLVRRVLTFDPRRSVSYLPTAVEPIIVEVAQQIQATLPASIRVRLSGLDAVTSIQGDATEIYQVLMNLCSNAVHAMPGGGILDIQLLTRDVLEPEPLALGQLQPGRWVSVSVTDSGIGLADEQIMSIFEPFYTTRQSTHGTGIGLTVVRNIISRMNGALNVDSRLGLGTRMTVHWPAVAAASAAATSAAPGQEGGDGAGAGETILVLDDEKELTALTEELLASLSYEPVGFSDSRAAIEAFRSDPQRFDAILTDERMQPLRGLEFARLIHDIEPNVPIILMTGHRDAKIDAGAKQAGIVEILDKPLRVQMLREALARHLRATRGTACKTVLAAGLAAVLVAWPRICAADDLPADDTHLAIGPAGYSLPSYPGARRTRNLAVPFIDAEYAGRLYSNASDLLGAYAYKSAVTEVGAAFEYEFTERLAQDDERFRHFRDVKETTRIKLFATHTVSFVTGDANIATDMAGHGQGTLAQGNVWFSLPVSPKLLLSAGPGATWADARYMQTFFGVTGAQAAVSPLPVYTSRPGIVDLHWNGLATYELSSRWSLGFAEYFAHLHGTAVDSPVTLRRRQATSLAWLAYKWK